jgi:predicted dehydrogenase
MKTLICGFGSIGRRHLGNLRTLGESDFILLRSHQSTLPDDELNGIPTVTDIRAALAHKPDAVIVSNPTALHLDVAIPAAHAGCAILLEKPVSHDMQHVDELRRALEVNGNRLLVGFQFRFHPVLHKVRELILKSEIGRITSFRAHWGEYLPGWHPWEDYRQSYSARPELGGGVVNTLSHPLDYLRWFFDDPEEVWAHTSSSGLGLDVEDTAEIGLCYRNGMTGSVHLDYIQQPPEHTLTVIGTGGTIKFDNANSSAIIHLSGKHDVEEILPPAGFERNHLFLDEMRHFLHVASGKELPACNFEDGIAALKLTLAVHQSARSDQLVRLEKS